MIPAQRSLVCPGCSGDLQSPSGRFPCPTCGAQLQIVPDSAHPGRGPQPRLDAQAARAALSQLFTNDGEPEPLDAAGTDARLYFVPFYEVTGTMVGIAPDGRPVHRWAEARIAGIEDRDDLGVAAIDAARLDADGAEVLASVAALGAAGTLLLPDREREEIEAFLGEEVRIPGDGPSAVLIDRRLALLYYPIWRLRVTAGDDIYQATIDGLNGTVLRARVPAKQRRRAFLSVVATACGGYLLGVMLRHPALGVPMLMRSIASTSPPYLLPALAVVLTATAFYVLLVNAAWNALRYRNEVLYTAGLKTRVLVDRPTESLLDRGTAAVKGAWSRLLAPRRYDR